MNLKAKLYAKLYAVVYALCFRLVATLAPHNLAKFVNNTRGEISINAIIMLAVGLTVAAALLPSAIVTISNTTSYTGAPASVLTIVPVLGIVAIVAVLLMILNR